jgi:hypothetical protein
VAAGDAGGATGAGRRNTKIKVNTEMASVAMLIIRCTFKKDLRRCPRWYRE